MDDIVDTRLILITPPLTDETGFAEKLAAACGTGEIAAVILRTGDEADERRLVERLKPLVVLVQEAGVAALVEGAPEILGKSGADGLHAMGVDAAREAVERFRPAKIVGAGMLRARDDAMTVGEAEADYVMFGDAGADGGRPPFEAVVDRVAWWAEVFQIPCVGVAPDLDGVAPLTAARAEFVALDAWAWDEADIAATVRAALDTIARVKAEAVA